jgi:hypothetical protein
MSMPASVAADLLLEEEEEEEEEAGNSQLGSMHRWS